MLIREFWKIPFLRLIIPLITGILFADYFSISPFIWFGATLFFTALVIVFRPFIDHNLSYHNRWVFGLAINLAIFSMAAGLTTKDKQFESQIAKSDLLIGYVNKPPTAAESTVKFELKLREYRENKIWNKTSEKILLSIEKDSASLILNYGDCLLIKGNLKEIENSGNPSEFDYKKFLARKQIHFRSFQSAGQWKLLSRNEGNPLTKLAVSLRDDMLNVFKETGIKDQEFALLAALTLGAKDYLSDELIEAYSDSGAMHVLSVSGLHVGIIFIVLGHFLFFMRKSRKLRILQGIIILLVVWFYALLTGLSPSVARSAAMISFVIAGKISDKKPGIYNSIVASAFILLCFDPLILFDVGFQLSYLAVISLVFFQPRIYNLFETSNYLLDKIWNLTAVSIAAQIGTSALSIYYFHQFPVYALIANLVVVPTAFVIMVLAIVLLFCSIYLPLAKMIGLVLTLSIKFLNSTTQFIENLPLATIKPISNTGMESILFHIALVLIMVYVVNKNKKYLIAVPIILISAFLVRDIRYFKHMGTETFTVYNVYKKSAFSIIRQSELNLYADTVLTTNEKAINYLTSNIMASNFITRLNLEKITFIKNDEQSDAGKSILNHLVQMDSVRIIFLSGDYSRFASSNKLKVNYVVLSKNASMELESIRSLFDFDLLIADSSVPKWKQEVLKRDCQNLEIPFYNVSESGAFIHQISY